MNFNSTVELLNRRFQESRDQSPRYRPFLDFWEKILQVQSRFISANEPASFPQPDSRTQMMLREGFPLSPFQDVPVPPERMRALFQEILRALDPVNPKISAQLPLLEDWLANSGPDFQTWRELVLREDGRAFIREAEANGLDPGILLFLFLASWKPFLKSQALALKQTPGFDWTVWSKGFCPVCGGPPLLAYLQQDGKRWGVCSLCEFSWNLPRFLCPECETSDPQRLRYFFTEPEHGFRVEVCDGCRHYLKTIDLREVGGEPLPLLDDLLTTHLDLWARDKGYHKLALTDQIG
ncbi:MAG: formate dehydrogenase accessory protein FdhE [Deltaproteobacteria bacterium]|nr:formate dehydrogenase accessory protein FdhE [Deltaproteobacteria bacterium]